MAVHMISFLYHNHTHFSLNSKLIIFLNSLYSLPNVNYFIIIMVDFVVVFALVWAPAS